MSQYIKVVVGQVAGLGYLALIPALFFASIYFSSITTNYLLEASLYEDSFWSFLRSGWFVSNVIMPLPLNDYMDLFLINGENAMDAEHYISTGLSGIVGGLFLHVFVIPVIAGSGLDRGVSLIAYLVLLAGYLGMLTMTLPWID